MLQCNDIYDLYNGFDLSEHSVSNLFLSQLISTEKAVKEEMRGKHTHRHVNCYIIGFNFCDFFS